MALDSLSPDDKRKFNSWMEAALKELQEIDDRKNALRDSAKAVAEEFGIKAKELMASARTAFKNDLEAKKEAMDIVCDILIMTGHG
jgi:uncharacterized membrane protein